MSTDTTAVHVPLPAASPLVGQRAEVTIDHDAVRRAHDETVAELTRTGVMGALRTLYEAHARAQFSTVRVDTRALGLMLDAFPLLVAGVSAEAGRREPERPASRLVGADGHRIATARATALDIARHVVPAILADGAAAGNAHAGA